MPGKKQTRKDGGWKDISNEVGFFYSPIVENGHSHVSASRRNHHPKTRKQFAVVKSVFDAGVKFSYRLVLKESCPFKEYISDAEKHIEWDDVSSLECFIGSEDCCPICLMPHSVPRATPCGHIFCAACILYYLRKQDEEYVKCPMCNEYISLSSMRPVRLLPPRESVTVNRSATLYLVARRRDSRNAFAIANMHSPYYLSGVTPYADGEERDLQFCHVLVNSPYYEYSNLQRDLKDVEASRNAMEVMGEELLQGALIKVKESIEQRMECLRKVYASQLDTASSSLSSPSSSSLSTRSSTSLLTPSSYSLSSPSSASLFTASLQSLRLPTDLFYYYTLPYNLNYHLLPLCFQCLRAAVPAYAATYSVLTGTVREIDAFELTPEVVRTNYALSHVPLYTTLFYVEIDVLELLRGIRLPENLFERVKKREKQRKWNQMKDKKEERMMSVGIERESDG